MALSDIETKRIEIAVSRFVEERRPLAHLRSQVDLRFRVIGQSFEIFEVRPSFSDPTETAEHAIAKATYVKSTEDWKLYWKRADLKWHRYDPCRTAETVEEVLSVVGEDKHCCFFG